MPKIEVKLVSFVSMRFCKGPPYSKLRMKGLGSPWVCGEGDVDGTSYECGEAGRVKVRAVWKQGHDYHEDCL